MHRHTHKLPCSPPRVGFMPAEPQADMNPVISERLKHYEDSTNE